MYTFFPQKDAKPGHSQPVDWSKTRKDAMPGHSQLVVGVLTATRIVEWCIQIMRVYNIIYSCDFWH